MSGIAGEYTGGRYRLCTINRPSDSELVATRLHDESGARCRQLYADTALQSFPGSCCCCSCCCCCCCCCQRLSVKAKDILRRLMSHDQCEAFSGPFRCRCKQLSSKHQSKRHASQLVPRASPLPASSRLPGRVWAELGLRRAHDGAAVNGARCTHNASRPPGTRSHRCCE